MTAKFDQVKLILNEGGINRNIIAKIYEPQRSSSGDAYCVVVVDGFLNSEKAIYGLDENQAKTLAIEFLTTLLSGYVIYSETGSPTSLPEAFLHRRSAT